MSTEPSREPSTEPPEPPPIEELIVRHQANDPDAFTALYRQLHPRLVRFFRAWTASRAAADDLAQATLLKLHEVRHTYEPGRPAAPWIWAIARNVRTDEARRQAARGRQRSALAAEPLEDELRPDELFEQAGDDRAVREALSGLPDSQREVIVLHHFEGLALRDVAAALGCTLMAAKLRAHRGYETLRRVLRTPPEGPK